MTGDPFSNQSSHQNIPCPRSRGTTKRSAARPLGEESYESVRIGNLLTARTLVILMIAHALRCFWVLEQPKGSVMELHPCFQEVLGRMTVWKHCIQMQMFGAPTAKPTWLYASSLAAAGCASGKLECHWVGVWVFSYIHFDYEWATCSMETV